MKSINLFTLYLNIRVLLIILRFINFRINNESIISTTSNLCVFFNIGENWSMIQT